MYIQLYAFDGENMRKYDRTIATSPTTRTRCASWRRAWTSPAVQAAVGAQDFASVTARLVPAAAPRWDIIRRTSAGATVPPWRVGGSFTIALGLQFAFDMGRLLLPARLAANTKCSIRSATGSTACSAAGGLRRRRIATGRSVDSEEVGRFSEVGALSHMSAPHR